MWISEQGESKMIATKINVKLGVWQFAYWKNF
jgi:hypothetical protein